MHIRRGYLGWGVFLILTGAVPLLVRSGYLSQDQVDRLWNLWPVILIGIGIGLVLRRTRFDFIGGLVVAATFGLMLGGLLSQGIDTFAAGACGSDEDATAFAAQDGSFAGSSAAVDLELDCGTAAVTVAGGTAWHLEGSDRDGAGPVVEADDESLRVQSRDRDGGSFFGFGQRDTWRLTLPNGTRLDLDVELNAGSSTLDLAGASLGTARLTVNAGSVTVDLTEVREIEGIEYRLNAGSIGLTLPNHSMTGSIEANAGSVKLCAPSGAGLRLHTGDSVIAGYDYGDQGLVQDGTTWTTPGFDTASVQIDLRTEATAGSFSLNPEDGCD
jgi:LiaF transmembrane domain/Toastrack DUF4097